MSEAGAKNPSEGCGLPGGVLLLAMAAGAALAAWTGSSRSGIPFAVTTALEVLAAVTFALGGLWAIGVHRWRPGSADTAVGLAMAGAFVLGADVMSRDGFRNDGNVVFFVGALAFAFLGYWYAWDMSKGDGTSALDRFRSWRMAVAAAQTLAFRRRRLSLGVNARGEIDGVPVRIVADRSGIAVEASADGVPGDLVLEPESARSLARAVFPETVLTGDDRFDGRVFVRGGEAAALSVLDGPARAALLPLIAAGATLSGGRLRATRRERGRGYARLDSSTDIAELARTLARAIALLARRREIPAALLANVRADEDGGVRAASVRCLRREYADAPETADAVALALADPDPAVRAAATDPARDAGRLSIAAPDGAGALSPADSGGGVSLVRPKKDAS